MYEPTQAEKKAIWLKAGLWRDGHKFEDDIKVPVIERTLRQAVIAQHKSHPELPAQASLALETA